MNVTILKSSPRKKSNTALLLEPVIQRLQQLQVRTDIFDLFEMHIEPCKACWTCQNVFSGFGCPQKDDMHQVFASVLGSDCVIFSSPIYSWYCTPPLKAVLDRLVYGMAKYYGKTEGPCLWEGKRCAIVTSCGYEIEHGAGVFEEGIKRYAKHSRLVYLGMLAARDADPLPFETDETKQSAQEFADKIFNSI